MFLEQEVPGKPTASPGLLYCSLSLYLCWDPSLQGWNFLLSADHFMYTYSLAHICHHDYPSGSLNHLPSQLRCHEQFSLSLWACLPESPSERAPGETWPWTLKIWWNLLCLFIAGKPFFLLKHSISKGSIESSLNLGLRRYTYIHIYLYILLYTYTHTYIRMCVCLWVIPTRWWTSLANSAVSWILSFTLVTASSLVWF